MKKFKTIENNTKIEIEEKRSRFIANIFYIDSVQNAEDFIRKTKKQYYDARHNCYAYIVKEEQMIKKSSDDGEPSGTAGSPILNVIEKNDLSNVLIVVTRYFGGILLGAGGLVRAYTEAATKVIESSKIVNQEEGYEVKVIISYQDLEKFKYYCNKNNIKIIDIKYEESIICIIEVTTIELEKILNISKYDKINFNVIKEEIVRRKYINK